jgi:hypothetical protein
MKAGTRRLSRRSFLLAIGAGGAATAAALVATRTSTESSPVPGKGKRATRGYHASEHINTYYRTAKV